MYVYTILTFKKNFLFPSSIYINIRILAISHFISFDILPCNTSITVNFMNLFINNKEIYFNVRKTLCMYVLTLINKTESR